MSTRLQIMGSRIRTARQFRRLTGEQLAEKIGIAVDSLRHIENGVRSPSFQLIERISDILDVSLARRFTRLLSWEDGFSSGA